MCLTTRSPDTGTTSTSSGPGRTLGAPCTDCSEGRLARWRSAGVWGCGSCRDCEVLEGLLVRTVPTACLIWLGSLGFRGLWGSLYGLCDGRLDSAGLFGGCKMYSVQYTQCVLRSAYYAL